jgi:hypothetical protein
MSQSPQISLREEKAWVAQAKEYYNNIMGDGQAIVDEFMQF